MKPKNIVLGITGGIAAYKSCEIVRLFIKAGNQVQVMMSKAAQQFITPLTLQVLSGKPVATELFSLTEESRIGHIQIADTADAIVLAPATADLIAKAAHGFCDDIVTTILLATKAPIFFAPSMNVNMYENQITQDNIAALKKRGVHFIDPESGDLACGWNGVGRLAEPEKIVSTVLANLSEA